MNCSKLILGEATPMEERLASYFREPWKLKIKPIHVIGDIYFVGNSWVSCYLVDTGAGLVLIDTGHPQASYQLFDSIRQLGYDPADIRYLFLSHAHVDHVGAARYIQECSGCENWMCEKDDFLVKERKDLNFVEDCIYEFKVDHRYDFTKPLTIGRTTFEFVHTPGHTPGAVSFLVHTQHNQKECVCAMHGGWGIRTLKTEVLERLGLPLSLQREYLEGFHRLKDKKVDVIIPSHMGHYPPARSWWKDDGSKAMMLQPDAWKQLMDEKIKEAMTLFE